MMVLGIVCVLSLALNAFLLTKGSDSTTEKLNTELANLKIQQDSIKHDFDSLKLIIIPNLNKELEKAKEIRKVYDAVLEKNASPRKDIEKILKDKNLE